MTLLTRSATGAGLAALALTIGLAVVTGSSRQESAAVSQDSGTVKVTLGEQSAQPGAPVVLLLTLSVPAEAPPSSIEVRLTYPTALLTFVKVEPSGLALGVSATVEAVVVKGPDANSSTVKATITTPAGVTPRDTLSSGALAYFSFKVAKEAKPATTIPVTLGAVMKTADTKTPALSPVLAVNGKVTVTAPPVPSCFFYMH
jgi:hypothetical protein